MFDKVCLYTTAKCRSMTTQEEFVDMWNDLNNKVREIIGVGLVLFADRYVIVNKAVQLFLNDIFIGTIFLDMIKRIA